jgi:hypothetical protein
VRRSGLDFAVVGNLGIGISSLDEEGKAHLTLLVKNIGATKPATGAAQLWSARGLTIHA